MYTHVCGGNCISYIFKSSTEVNFACHIHAKLCVTCLYGHFSYFLQLNMLNKRNLLTSTKAYNIVLKAYSRLGAMGALCTDYKKMIEDQIAPDLETYHILVEGSLRTGSVRSTRRTVYDFWRSFVKEVPRIRPDTELINKFIECCGVCQEHERAFFYLSVLNEYSLLPNLETFKLLLQVILQWFLSYVTKHLVIASLSSIKLVQELKQVVVCAVIMYPVDVIWFMYSVGSCLNIFAFQLTIMKVLKVTRMLYNMSLNQI